MIVPPVLHVLPLTTIRRQRTLPVPGRITVELNQRVRPRDVVAEAEIAPRHLFIDVAHTLGVDLREVSRYLTKERDERVEKGEVIAGPVGITRRTVRAPNDGRIVAVVEGRVLFEIRSEPLLIKAGIPGEVVASDGLTSVTIETTGALIQGVWGNNRQDFGVMRIIGEGPRDRLLTDQLDTGLRGAILIAGICDHPAPLYQAQELALRGLVLGGLSAELIPVAERLPYPVVVLEGFGSIPISPPIFELISTSRGREAGLDAHKPGPYDAQRPEIIIPLPVVNPVDLPEEIIPLSPGVRVRVTRAPYQGMVGIVQRILPQAVSYPNGVLARSAIVDLDVFGRTNVPLANLEILQ
jgi:hypothetical protein